jgi:hypothetical protein
MALKRFDDNSPAPFDRATTTDLSDLAANPFGGSSMSGGNTTTAKPDFAGGGQGAQGTESESTASLPHGQVPDIFAAPQITDTNRVKG